MNDYYPTGYQGGYGGGQQGENDSPSTFRMKENNYPSYKEIRVFDTLIACMLEATEHGEKDLEFSFL